MPKKWYSHSGKLKCTWVIKFHSDQIEDFDENFDWIDGGGNVDDFADAFLDGNSPFSDENTEETDIIGQKRKSNTLKEVSCTEKILTHIEQI